MFILTDISTRERIVATADDLFYQKGYEQTSFADIAQAVKISRGNFYHHFKTKDKILDAVIARRLTKTKNMLAAWESEGERPADRILSFINILTMNQAKIVLYGCPVGTLSAELAKLDHIARDQANEIFALFRDWLVRQFRLMGITESADTFAMQLLSRSQGAAVMASAFQDASFLRQEVTQMSEWLDRCHETP